MNGLKKAEADIVLIHDGARALVTDDEINNSVADCIKFGAAAVGVKCKDTLKSADSTVLQQELLTEKNVYDSNSAGVLS